MSLTNSAEQAFLDLLFTNVNWANIGDATGLRSSSANGVFYISLHSSDPGEAGNQSSNEISYTPYARASINREGATWVRAGSTISNNATISFAQCTSGTASITHFGIGTDLSGNGNLIMKGNLTATLAVSAGIAPQFAVGALTATVE
jgi:hypothetical protein